MTSSAFGHAEIHRFLDAAAAELEGDWVLLGGSAAAAWFLPTRVTEDIDLVSVSDTPEARSALMDLAEARGLSVESVNSAAGYFLRKIPDWRQNLEVLRTGRATIYRPTPTLFILLKLSRLAESDAADCAALMDACEAGAWPLDRARLIAALDALPATPDAALRDRRDALRQRLTRRG
jgi:hypothetical protein